EPSPSRQQSNEPNGCVFVEASQTGRRTIHPNASFHQLSLGGPMVSPSRALRLLLLAFLVQSVAARGETATTPPDDQGWPRPLPTRAGIFSIYQPQLDSWDGFRYQAHAAVAVKVPGDSRDVYGVIWIDARTQVDKPNRLVTLNYLRIPKVQFPSAADKGQAFQTALQESIGAQPPAALS